MATTSPKEVHKFRTNRKPTLVPIKLPLLAAVLIELRTDRATQFSAFAYLQSAPAFRCYSDGVVKSRHLSRSHSAAVKSSPPRPVVISSEIVFLYSFPFPGQMLLGVTY